MPSLWQSPNFRKYIAALLSNSFALQLITLTVGWQIYELTRNPLDLGLVGLSQAVPIFLLFLVALARAHFAAKLPLGLSAMAFLASMLPFGPFVLDQRLAKYQDS